MDVQGLVVSSSFSIQLILCELQVIAYMDPPY
jgi:hypothetical protein